MSDADLRVIVIVKKPLLALRYQLSDGQVSYPLPNLCHCLMHDKQFRRFQLNFKPESGFDYALNTLQSIGLPVRDRTIMARPQSAQATLAGTTQQVLQEQAHVIGEPQSSTDPSSQPKARMPQPTYSASYLSAQSQHGPSVSGVDQDDSSRPLLPVTSRAGLGDATRYGSRLTQQVPALSPGLLRQQDVGTDFRRSPTHHAESVGFDWHSNPYGLNPTRPTTAPVTKAERQAPDIIPLSLMLPPDRVLPFPGEGEALSRETTPASKSSQRRPRSSVSHLAKKKPRATRAKPSKAEVSQDNGGRSTALLDSLAQQQVATPYDLRPSSSSSTIELSAPAPVCKPTPVSSLNASAQDRIVQSRAKLAKSDWALSKADFLKHFNEEAFGSIAFLDELVRFAKIQKSFKVAHALLEAAQRARQDRLGVAYITGHSFREWTSNDVRSAIIAYRSSEPETPSAILSIRKANTPKKLVRASSLIREDVREQARKPAVEVVQDTAAAPSFSTPIFSPVTPSQSRKRPASVLRETSGNGQTVPANATSGLDCVIEQQPANAAVELQVGPPAITPPDIAVSVQEQSAAVAASLTPLIQPTDLTSILDDWAKNSGHLFAAPKPAQTPKQVLAAFVAQDQGTRIKNLDELIRECIDDENFVRLAEDVEGTWMSMAPRP